MSTPSLCQITDGPDYQRIPLEVNRLRVYHLSWRQLVCFFNGAEQYPYTISVPMNALPPGSRVWNVFMKPLYMSLGVVVEHPSFDEVKEGHEIPGEGLFPIETKLFSLLGRDKFAYNWEMTGTSDLLAMRQEIDREITRRRVK